MTDDRTFMAKQLAEDIVAKSEELSTAIYQASKMGYSAVVSVINAVPIKMGDGRLRCVGADDPVVVQATISFDMIRAV